MVIHSSCPQSGTLVDKLGICNLVYITAIPEIRQIVQFSPGFLPAEFCGVFCEKLCLTRRKSRSGASERTGEEKGKEKKKLQKKFQKGVDFMENIRYNLFLHKRPIRALKTGTGGVTIHAQH